ncbi:Protein serin-threonin phosphatase [Halomicronema hongdechloris C2206]|uniref:Protein serin-threonin phosphatase n=1 Tax=Halomicronema hongdechloris C2206 TaxID=1641165 RepID=A0A1Z3HIJ7_9CYAN|nr:protein phosphatase 2C domain-containing protein [Halomicronema hongdechloris]ASC70103.1 Protein serin-threonin phosphatase [Halomicronema hongdechloris C2206]
MPYLWAVGKGVEAIPVGNRIADRYEVMAPHIWRDTKPQQLAVADIPVPELVQPYLRAYPHSLHLPQVYGWIEQSDAAPVLLLSNAPIHPRSGKLYPAIGDALSQATALRQAHWLWQMLTLWTPLQTLGVSESLLHPDNLRIEGWRLRLRELDRNATSPSLAQLAALWRSWLPDLQAELAESVETVCQAMVEPEADITQLSQQLNTIVLHQVSTVTLHLQIAGGTSVGQQPRNEDACYPEGLMDSSDTEAMPRLGIVCDGVGGHEGGEIASRLAVQSLQLQLRGLFSHAEDANEPLPPELVSQQLEAAIRVVNDLLNQQNDSQGRLERQRMGTTLALALLLPQRLQTASGWQPVSELYIAHVGDSRVYWITPQYCHCLTVDDDVAGREIEAGQWPQIARQHSQAGALTQALGTRSAAFLHPHIQRFILDEEGVLLLCTDGLSDYGRVEQSWANYIGLIVKDIITLEDAVKAWLELANQKNGHDNVSVVLMHCKPRLKATAEMASLVNQRQDQAVTDDLPATSKALLYGETPDNDAQPTPAPKPDPRPSSVSWRRLGWILAVIVVAVALSSWWFLARKPSTPESPGPSQQSP